MTDICNIPGLSHDWSRQGVHGTTWSVKGLEMFVHVVWVPSVWTPSASSANLLAHLEMIHHHSLKDHNVSPHFHKHTVVFIADGPNAVMDIVAMAIGRFHQRLTPGPALGLLLLWGNALQMHVGVRPPLMCPRLTPLATFPNRSSAHAGDAFISKLPSVLLLLPLPAPRGSVWSYQCPPASLEGSQRSALISTVAHYIHLFSAKIPLDLRRRNLKVCRRGGPPWTRRSSFGTGDEPQGVVEPALCVLWRAGFGGAKGGSDLAREREHRRDGGRARCGMEGNL
ncbi:unnamed protein product [Arctogadus glacialis]